MRNLFLILLLFVAGFMPLNAQDTANNHARGNWRPAQAENLLQWVLRAGDEAIELPMQTARDLREAIDTGERDHLNEVSDTAALQLLRAYHGQCCGDTMPENWHIAQSVTDQTLRDRIAEALSADRIDLVIRAARPDHPHYSALATAYTNETNVARRQLLALDLARWRSIPIPAEGRYLIVNSAAQELTLWEGTTIMDSWRVIVGKPSSPTPVFSVDVSGVVLNPWWNIPSSIAAEGIAAFVRQNPTAARAQGYVYTNGRYRQMPGDNNTLGRMKLVMPNRFAVILHDTSNRELFTLEERARSHGCVRVDRALQFAETLLSPDGWGASEIEQAIKAGRTVTIPLSHKIPLYVAYFTAAPDRTGTIRFFPDIYNRDGAAALRQANGETECALG
ncbi:MAG: L,D-transpeptidase family protein [Alteraurantiacibacter sp. bin_em_oilr2.035]|nr:L,D-transpeptidase family protein [Alteraurantiacibacter sp. bin_em_oilr2.035]